MSIAKKLKAAGPEAELLAHLNALVFEQALIRRENVLQRSILTVKQADELVALWDLRICLLRGEIGEFTKRAKPSERRRFNPRASN